MSERFTWLHFTDLHAGQKEHYFWPSIEAEVLEDLRWLHAKMGPFDAIFFTGDLVQAGRQDEFELFDRTFARVREELASLGSEPNLLAIPGNHDLIRPEELSGVVLAVEAWPQKAALREDFWSSTSGQLRVGVANAFEQWRIWWDANRGDGLDAYEEGTLAGDYRATLALRGLRIGVVGINSAFLQLRGGDVQEQLTVDLRQVVGAFPDGITSWAAEHDVTFLLTHHPLSWLDERGKTTLRSDLLYAGKIAVHLQGHVHEEDLWLGSQSGVGPRLTVLGRSLFGMEDWGPKGQRQKRLHGYSAGEITFGESSRTVRIWPRVAAELGGGGWHITKDPASKLDEDEALPAGELGFSPRLASKSSRHQSPLEKRVAGWQRIDRRTLERLSSVLSTEDLGRFYDGAAPRWSHALEAAGVPARHVVTDVVSALQSREASGDRTLALLVGPGGEGKSTALLQAAAAMARDSGWKVMWRPDADVALDAAAVVGIPQGPGPYLFVSDEADQLVAQLWRVHDLCTQRGRTDIHFLLAARDNDWATARGDAQAWGSALRRFSMRELSPDDARSVVRAWQRLGNEGLRRLASVDGEEARVAALLKASRNTKVGRGSFFGAVLSTRFTAADLRAHLQNVMNRLGDREPGGNVLRRGFIATAACDAIGLDGINRDVLADLLGVPRLRIVSDVVRPLGDEAAASYAGTAIRTRHVDIARAVTAIAEHGGVDEDLGELYAQIVRQTVITGRSVKGMGKWHGSAINMGPQIVRSLRHPDFSTERRLQIGIRAAETAVDADDEQPLTHMVTLARTWREGKQPQKGANILSAAFRDTELPDYVRLIRSAVYEWAVCAGETGDKAAGTVLSGYSICDHLNPAPITKRQAKLSLAGMGVTLLERLKAEQHRELADGVAACSFLGMRSSPDAKAVGYFARYLRDATKQGAQAPQTLQEAITSLTKAAATVAVVIGDPHVKRLPSYCAQTFGALSACLA